MTLDQALTNFLIFLRARNTSVLTQEAYATDVRQLMAWFAETSVLPQEIASVTKTDVIEYLSYPASLGRSGVTRARKLASLREFFSYLQKQDLISQSPAAQVAVPKLIYARTNTAGFYQLPAVIRAILPSCSYFSRPGSESANSSTSH